MNLSQRLACQYQQEASEFAYYAQLAYSAGRYSEAIFWQMKAREASAYARCDSSFVEGE